MKITHDNRTIDIVTLNDLKRSGFFYFCNSEQYCILFSAPQAATVAIRDNSNALFSPIICSTSRTTSGSPYSHCNFLALLHLSRHWLWYYIIVYVISTVARNNSRIVVNSYTNKQIILKLIIRIIILLPYACWAHTGVSTAVCWAEEYRQNQRE